MDSTNEQRWNFTQQVERNLQAYLAEKDPSFPDIAQFLAQYRSACENVILQDFNFAASKEVEHKLWGIHGRINNRFRKELKHVRQYREGGGKRKPVEQRKNTKLFLEFIKSSQRFYRGYIQRLASRFDGVHVLAAVANRLTLSTLSIDEPTTVSGTLRRSILISCHQTLICLGDLSRWRETQIVTKDRNWGPAKGYYDLAGIIYPASGASHNQLAVIALVDVDHLRATYHLYRALAVEEPHPSAQGNIEIEFKKIEEAWGRGELIMNDLSRDAQTSSKALVGWFVRLHARCYKGVDFSEHEELESEVLSQLAVELKERSMDGTLNKFVLINIAAEFFARGRLNNDSSGSHQEHLQSSLFFQRLNVKTFFTLLQILQSELERFAGEDEHNVVNKPDPVSAKVSAVMRRILPALRHYSSWLISDASMLLAVVGDTSLNTQIKELWKIYASTLTLLALSFPISELPLIEYLLEEDEDTLGFRPLVNEHTVRRYCSEDEVSSKPKWHDRGVQRHHPNVEMYGRVREFLTDGMFLQLQKEVPIKHVQGTKRFIYIEEGVPEEDGYPATLPLIRTERQEITHIDETTLPDAPASIDERASQGASASVSMDLASRRMVDDLVDSEITDDSEKEDRNGEDSSRYMLPPATNSSSGQIRSSSKETGNETSYDLINSSAARELFGDQPPASPRPLLPSIYNSPFAPQLGETTPNSRPSTAKRITPSHSQKSSQTTFPLQNRPNGINVHSSISSIPDSSGLNPPMNALYQNNPSLHGVFQQPVNYTTGRGPPTAYGNDPYGAVDSISFLSAEAFASNSWASGQNGFGATNKQTPPNGQGLG